MDIETPSQTIIGAQDAVPTYCGIASFSLDITWLLTETLIFIPFLVYLDR